MLVGREPIFEGSVSHPGDFSKHVSSWNLYLRLYGLGCLHKEAAGISLTQNPGAERVKAIPATFPFAGRHLLKIFL